MRRNCQIIHRAKVWLGSSAASPQNELSWAIPRRNLAEFLRIQLRDLSNVWLGSSAASPQISFWGAILALTVLLVPIANTIAGIQPDPPANNSEPSAPETNSAGPENPASAETAAPPPITGSREFLSLNRVDESHFRSLVDGRPVNSDENEALWRVLFAVRRLAAYPGEVERWAKRDATLDELTGESSAYRGELFHFAGRVTRVAVETPLPEVIARFDLKQYYRCDVVISAGEEKWPAIVYAINIPDAWKSQESLDERISFDGVYLKYDQDENGARRPIFVADRLAWRAETVLGELGVDVGLFDDVMNRRPLAPQERECFYQVLAAAGGAGVERLDRWTKGRKFSVVPLFNDPDSQSGELVALEGVARRAVEVRIDNPDIARRFGIDRYWEIEVFTEDSQSNPIAFCVLELPEGMPTGDGIYERVRIPGFFFKVWAYRVQKHSDADNLNPDGKIPRRYAPLVIGDAPLWIPREGQATTPFAGALAGTLFILALLGIWLALWWTQRRDKRYHKETLAKKYEPESPVALNDLSIPDEVEPNFGGPSQRA